MNTYRSARRFPAIRLFLLFLLLLPAGTGYGASAPRIMQNMLAPFSLLHDKEKLCCFSEDMLGMGEPPLTGPVRSVRVRQYVAFSRPDGEVAVSFPAETRTRVNLAYDQEGRLTEYEREMEWPLESGGKTKLYWRAEYNGDEVLSWQARDAVPYRYVTVRDGRGRPARLELFQGETLIRTEKVGSHDEASRTSSSVNSLGQLQTIIFDERGNPVRENWTSADAPGKGSMVSTMEYTGDDKPLHYRNDVLLPGNRSRTEARWTYDVRNRLIRMDYTFARGGKILRKYPRRYVWDDEDRLIAFEWGGYEGDCALRYLRDARGRVTELVRRSPTEKYPDRTETLRFTNDASGNWVRCVMRSPDRPTVIEREIAYYPL